MFLVAMTNGSIKERLGAYAAEERSAGKATATVVTDSVLSTFMEGPDGFSIVESPLRPPANPGDVVLARVDYDARKDVLTIFKPTWSGRPIYYHIDSHGGFFCSTHVSMLRQAGVVIEENSDILPELLVYDFVMPPQTMYKGIGQMAIGSTLHVASVDGRRKISRIDEYEPPEAKATGPPGDEIAEYVFACLRECIDALGTTEAELAVPLSGGIDSSILFRLCQDQYGLGTTASAGFAFEDPNHNVEREYALSAAEVFGTDHRCHDITVRDLLYGFLRGVSAVEGPLHHLQSIPFSLLYRDAFSPAQRIVICGHGADSVFGNDLHRFVYRGDRYRALAKRPILDLVALASRITGRGPYFVEALRHANAPPLSLSDPGNVTWTLGRYGNIDWVCEYLGVTKRDVIKHRYDAIRRFEGRSLYDVVGAMALLSSGSVTPAIWSKLAENEGKVLYCPFMKAEMLDYMLAVPWREKLRNRKDVLRRVGRRLSIPEFIITRRKSGGGMQSDRWAPRGSVFESIVPLAAKVVDEPEIRRLQVADERTAMTYWNILNYALWRRLCIDNEPLSVLEGELEESLRANGL